MHAVMLFLGRVRVNVIFVDHANDCICSASGHSDAGRVAMSHGMKEVVVKLKGPGMGRDSAVRALQSLGMIVTDIIDVTPVPHNGCRALTPSCLIVTLPHRHT